MVQRVQGGPGERSASAALFESVKLPGGNSESCAPVNAQTDDNNLMSSPGFLVEMRYNDLISTSCKNEK